MTQLMAYGSWWADENSTEDPPDALRHPKQPTPAPGRIADPDDIGRVYGQLKYWNRHPNNIRDYAALATLQYTGMRRSELIRLTVDDIDFDNRRITIAAGKNGDARIVPLYNFAAVAIRRYLTRIRDTHRHRDLKALWLGRDGALRADSITKIFNRISNEAGLDQPLKSHQLRRLLAKTWVNFSSCTAAAGSVVLQGRVPSLLAVWKRILRFGRFQAASTISADVH